MAGSCRGKEIYVSRTLALRTESGVLALEGSGVLCFLSRAKPSLAHSLWPVRKLPFLLRPMPGHYAADQMSSIFNNNNDNNNNLHLYKAYHWGILKYITNNN